VETRNIIYLSVQITNQYVLDAIDRASPKNQSVGVYFWQHGTIFWVLS